MLRTHTQRPAVIKPVSEPRRKQSLLYESGTSLISAEFNKCSRMEGIFHRQPADNGAIVAASCCTPLCIQSGPFGRPQIHGSCRGGSSLRWMCLCCETPSKINNSSCLCYLFIFSPQETVIYFSKWVNAFGHFSKFGLVAISQEPESDKCPAAAFCVQSADEAGSTLIHCFSKFLHMAAAAALFPSEKWWAFSIIH